MSFRPAARQFFSRPSAPGWQNPYDTNGLIAMWDGEWNAGGGIHDSSATTWKDLVGNNDLMMDSNVVWQDKCSFQNSKLKTATRENASVDWAFAEVVCDWSLIAGTADTAACFSAGLSVGSDMPNIYGNFAAYYNSGRTKYFCQFKAVGRPTKYAEIESPVSETSALSGTLSFDKASQTVWRNAQQLTMQDQSVSYLYNNQNIIFIGSNNTSNERAFKGKFYCIRLYSSVLSQAQISANYAMDKQRFNLP